MFRRRRARLDAEVEAHLAEETADNVARGMDPAAARRAAIRTFGNVEAAKERVREMAPWYWLDTLLQDIRFGLRLVARDPWTSATILATLTVGIALNVSMFSLINALLLRPWVRAQPETFVSVVPRFSGEYQLRYADGGLSQPDYAYFRAEAKSLESLAAYRLLALTMGGAEAGSVRAGLVSCNLFDVLRPGPPIAGRYLAPDECATPGNAPVAILGETAWRRTFGADPAIVGREVLLNRIPFTVIGVAPSVTLAGAGGHFNERDVWVPYTMLGTLRPADEYFSDPRAEWLVVVGRRRPEYSQAQVQHELGRLARAADANVPGRVTSLIVTDGSLIQDPDMGARTPLLISTTIGTTSVLLLLACVNVTTLLLSRAAARQREIAVRLSLGAGRFRLLRQLLTESLILSALAAAIGVVVAHQAPAALWHSVTSSPAPFDLTPDWRVFLYASGVAVATGIISGLSPAMESLRRGTSESLKGSGAALTPGPRRSRVRSALVTVQIALSLLILVQAGLFARAQRQFASYDPGFETRQVLAVTFASVQGGYEPPASFYRELEWRVAAVPGVRHASYAAPAPWAGRRSSGVTEIDGRPLLPTRGHESDPASRAVSPGYFAALGVPVTRGRVFTRDETAEGQPVPTVISEAMALRYWPGEDPLGRRFRAGEVHEVVGVSHDVQSVRYMQDDGPMFHTPLDLRRSSPALMLVRVAGDTGTAAALRTVIGQLDPQMAYTMETLASIVEGHGQRLKPVMIYGSAAGLLALLLALSGVYGVVSFSVSQRTRELGIRVALGARRRDVLAQVLRSGAGPICAGLVVGLGLNLAVSIGMDRLLFGLNPRDPATLALGSIVLLGCALVAIGIPARRAARLDPLSALRQE